MNRKNRVTKFGIHKISLAISDTEQERQKVVERLSKAREYGDLKENAEYSEARTALSRIDQELFEMKNDQRNFDVVTVFEEDVVGFGSEVILLNLENKNEEKYQIVGDIEANFATKMLSENSPFASAMLTRKKGDTFEFVNNAGVRKFKILDISYDWLK